MLRIYLVQNLYNLSDMATVAEVIDSRAFSDFCGVESSNQVPDGDTLGRFRNILLKNGIQQELFEQVVEFLTQRGLILKRGTIVDSTFIEAPSSTKNQKKERDPEAHSAKKGNVWYFWYKAHIGVDSESGLVHTVQVTAANVHDVCVTADLLTGEEEQVYGDSGYLGAETRPEARQKNTVGKKIRYKINRRPSQSKNNSARSQAQIKRREHEKSSVRAKVEHVFAVLKLQLRYRKTRYIGVTFTRLQECDKLFLMFVDHAETEHCGCILSGMLCKQKYLILAKIQPLRTAARRSCYETSVSSSHYFVIAAYAIAADGFIFFR